MRKKKESTEFFGVKVHELQREMSHASLRRTFKHQGEHI